MWENEIRTAEYRGASANLLHHILTNKPIGDFDKLELGKKYIIEDVFSPVTGFTFYRLKDLPGWYPAGSFRVQKVFRFEPVPASN